EDAWLNHGQAARVGPPDLRLYHDSDLEPQTYAYDAVARMNVEAVLAAGYAGASSGDMALFPVEGGATMAKPAHPTGQAAAGGPPGQGGAGGRSGDHSGNAVVYGNLLERLAARHHGAGDEELAGRYRRAARLALRSIERWRRADGSYSVTKNHFDPALGVGYA